MAGNPGNQQPPLGSPQPPLGSPQPLQPPVANSQISLDNLESLLSSPQPPLGNPQPPLVNPQPPRFHQQSPDEDVPTFLNRVYPILCNLSDRNAVQQVVDDPQKEELTRLSAKFFLAERPLLKGNTGLAKRILQHDNGMPIPPALKQVYIGPGEAVMLTTFQRFIELEPQITHLSIHSEHVRMLFAFASLTGPPKKLPNVTSIEIYSEYNCHDHPQADTHSCEYVETEVIGCFLRHTPNLRWIRFRNVRICFSDVREVENCHFRQIAMIGIVPQMIDLQLHNCSATSMPLRRLHEMFGTGVAAVRITSDAHFKPCSVDRNPKFKTPRTTYEEILDTLQFLQENNTDCKELVLSQTPYAGPIFYKSCPLSPRNLKLLRLKIDTRLIADITERQSLRDQLPKTLLHLDLIAHDYSHRNSLQDLVQWVMEGHLPHLAWIRIVGPSLPNANVSVKSFPVTNVDGPPTTLRVKSNHSVFDA